MVQAPLSTLAATRMVAKIVAIPKHDSQFELSARAAIDLDTEEAIQNALRG